MYKPATARILSVFLLIIALTALVPAAYVSAAPSAAIRDGDARKFADPPDVIAYANANQYPSPAGVSITTGGPVMRLNQWLAIGKGGWINANLNVTANNAGIQFWGDTNDGWARVLVDGTEIWTGNTYGADVYYPGNAYVKYLEITGLSSGAHNVKVENMGIGGTGPNSGNDVTIFFFGMKTSAPTAPPPATATAPSGLVAYYSFDGNTKDYSGSGKDGTNNGASFVNGVRGQALRFDGKTNYVSAPVNINPDAMPQVTMTAWAKADELTGSVISQDNGGFDRTISIDGRGGGLGWSAFAGTGSVLGYHTAARGEWVFIAAVYDQNAKTVKIYVNGAVREKAGSLGQGWPYINIGRNPSFGEYFTGTIDEVRIYNRALSASELAAVKDGDNPSPAPNPPSTPVPGQTPGATPQPGAVPNPPAPVAAVNRVRGDANGDGKITALDALYALQMAVNKRAADLIVDINSDGKVTADDARLVLQMAVGSAAVQAPGSVKYEFKEVAVADVSRAAGGGRLAVNDPSSPLNGLTIDFPPGALGSDDTITVKLGSVTNADQFDCTKMIQTDSSVVAGLNGRVEVLNKQKPDYVYDPFWLTALWSTSESRPAYPMLSLEPSGYSFQKPVQVKMPLPSSLPQDFDPDNLLLLSGRNQSDGSVRWEALADYQVDPVSRTVTVQVNHFSFLYAAFVEIPVALAAFFGLVGGAYAGSTYYDVDRAAAKYNLVETARKQLRDEKQVYRDFAIANVCYGGKTTYDPRQIPALKDLLWYLATFIPSADYADLQRKKVWTGLEDQMTRWVREKLRDSMEQSKATGLTKEVPIGGGKVNTVPYAQYGLTLAGLYGKALEMTNGDVFRALLLCHNVTRGADGDFRKDDAPVQLLLEQYRGDGDDEAGARYHFFGMAAYAFAVEHYKQQPAADRYYLPIPSAELAHNIEKKLVSSGGSLVKDPKEYVVGLHGILIGQNAFVMFVQKSREELIRWFAFDPADICKDRAPRPDNDECDCNSIELQFAGYSKMTDSGMTRWYWQCTNRDQDPSGIRLTLNLDYYANKEASDNRLSAFKTETKAYPAWSLKTKPDANERTTVIDESGRIGRITYFPKGVPIPNYFCLLEYQYGKYIIEINMSAYKIDESRIKTLAARAVELGIKIINGTTKVNSVPSFPPP